MEILSCKNLSFRYNSSTHDTLSDITFSLESSGIMLVVGKTGSGKSTLLRLLKKEIAPAGKLSGSISIFGKDHSELSLTESTCSIACVSQNPDTQTVTHKVSAELAFALENLGIKPSQILSRVGEMSAYFGIEDIYDKPIDQLSGGEKQLCCLCAATVLSPRILILDEPVAQLDPIGSGKFFAALRRLNSELGTTMLIAEHDPDEVFEFCDSVLVLDNGRSVYYSDRESFVAAARNDPLLRGWLPAQTRAALKLGKTVFTVKQAKNLLEERFPQADIPQAPAKPRSKAKASLKAENVYFRYERSGKDVVSCLDLDVYSGEVFAAVGSNGSGKTTMLKLLSGILRPWQGRISINGKAVKSHASGSAAYMPQDPYHLFICDTVRHELERTSSDKQLIHQLCTDLGVDHLLEMHPYDLSGGEVQKCALVKLLLTQPDILLLDEPSKGLDPQAKAIVGKTLRELASQGKAICIATHDLEFAAQFADRCGLYFNGCIHSAAPCREFFSQNRFYTTASSRIARNVFADVVTADELEKRIAGGDSL